MSLESKKAFTSWSDVGVPNLISLSSDVVLALLTFSLKCFLNNADINLASLGLDPWAINLSSSYSSLILPEEIISSDISFIVASSTL